jgi:hypothetical protein
VFRHATSPRHLTFSCSERNDSPFSNKGYDSM